MSALTKLDLIGLLNRECRAVGGQSEFADRHGMSRSYVHRVLNSECPPGPNILAALRLRKVVRYVPTNGGPA